MGLPTPYSSLTSSSMLLLGFKSKVLPKSRTDPHYHPVGLLSLSIVTVWVKSDSCYSLSWPCCWRCCCMEQTSWFSEGKPCTVSSGLTTWSDICVDIFLLGLDETWTCCITSQWDRWSIQPHLHHISSQQVIYVCLQAGWTGLFHFPVTTELFSFFWFQSFGQGYRFYLVQTSVK